MDVSAKLECPATCCGKCGSSVLKCVFLVGMQGGDRWSYIPNICRYGEGESSTRRYHVLRGSIPSNGSNTFQATVVVYDVSNACVLTRILCPVPNTFGQAGTSQDKHRSHSHLDEYKLSPRSDDCDNAEPRKSKQTALSSQAVKPGVIQLVFTH